MNSSIELRDTFREDVQALRGLAVLLVFLSHVGVSWFEGGYVGVDIFFVISGYVITNMLYEERLKNGQIELLRFYSRRLLRLLPAFLLMTVVVCIASVFLLSPDDALVQLSDAGFANLWFSNFHFLNEELDYFAIGSQGSLFLHTWSLSVEEQFYILWPAVMMFGLAVLRPRMWVLIVFGLFLYYCVIAIYSPNQAFYFPVARFWQFALGAAVVYLNLNLARTIGKGMSYSAIACIKTLACAGIALASISINFERHYAVLPSLAAAVLLIDFGGQVQTLSRLVLYPLVLLGNLSYSFYLWHWPIIQLGERFEPIFGQNYSAIWYFLITLGVSYTSYRLIENPLRYCDSLRQQHLRVVGCSVVLIVVVQVGLLGCARAYENVRVHELNSIEGVRGDLSKVYEDDCDTWHWSASINPCVYGKQDAEYTVVMFGDSVLLQWFPVIQPYFANQNWKVVVLTKASCALPAVGYYYPKISSNYYVCDQWKNSVYEYLDKVRPAVIFVGGDTSYRISDELWLSGTAEALERLGEVSQSVFVVGDNPSLPFDAVRCISRLLTLGEILPRSAFSLDACTSPKISANKNSITELAVSQFDFAHYMDVDEIVCPGGLCRALKGNVVVYRDQVHITGSFAKLASREFIAELERLFIEGQKDKSP